MSRSTSDRCERSTSRSLRPGDEVDHLVSASISQGLSFNGAGCTAQPVDLGKSGAAADNSCDVFVPVFRGVCPAPAATSTCDQKQTT